ncbi:DUF4421 domain-containing protein [Prevotella intermedia]|jgi:hypothetical protein|uniref:DUF4421 domain-containing protein n=1 Tax=Prevotella intermedia TaxID=28131 RepID=A0A2M8TR51_PREIN|nr:DUF4421 domain-containing protein [Prevotella intermedia]PJI26417.1 hypothetical protein CTM58_11950 [Prevotella intermedia]
MPIKATIFCLLMLLFAPATRAESSRKTISESTEWQRLDSVKWQRPDTTKRWFHRHLRNIGKTMGKMNDIDTTYIEPQRYNFTAMIQNTNNFEVYVLNNQQRHHLTLAPEPAIRIGPYLGWRWIFLGYTIDIKHPFFNSTEQKRKEFDLSLYSSKIGFDLYYRKTGQDFKIRRLSMDDKIDTTPLEGMSFDGVESTVKGFNIYYIFNHRRFSYPAAFSQSTTQRKSAGSPLIGIGYTKHTLKFDWAEFYRLAFKHLKMNGKIEDIENLLETEEIRYTNISVSGGYAYNYVFAHNWLLAASATIGLAYKHSGGKILEDNFSLRRIISNNINFIGTTRFGVVWNNTKWYAGTSLIMHSFSYHREHFSTRNLFGNLNFYVGMNFGKRGKAKQNKDKTATK